MQLDRIGFDPHHLLAPAKSTAMPREARISSPAHPLPKSCVTSSTRRALSALLVAAAGLLILAGSARAQNPNYYSAAYGSDLKPGNQQTDPPRGEKEKGDPVILATGNLEVEATDLSIAGRGLDFNFTRHYRSGSDVHSALGPKWDFNWNQYISYEKYHTIPGGGAHTSTQSTVPAHAFYFNGEQRIEDFVGGNSPTLWTTPAGYFAKLRMVGNISAFILRSADGKILTFDVFDRYGDPFVAGPLFHLSRVEDRE